MNDPMLLTPGQLERAKRRAKALKLYRESKSFAEIAKELGVSRQRAHQLVNEAIRFEASAV